VLLVRLRTRLPVRDDRGQTTAEYALVLVGVAAIALLVVAWAGDTNKIGRLLDGVLDSILDKLP
jgi:Flp pilus assembly pilin Flp